MKPISINNLLLSLITLEILALTLRHNVEIVVILTVAQIVIFIAKLSIDSAIYRQDKQLLLPLEDKSHSFHNLFNHYILPITQLIVLNVFFITYQSYLTYLIQIAVNIFLFFYIYKNIDAWFKNKYIVEAHTHYIYDIISLFILFNTFWTGEIFINSYESARIVILILFILFVLALVFTLMRYNILHFNKVNLAFVLVNIMFFVIGVVFWGISLKLALLVTYGYYLTLSLLHHYLNADFKWGVIFEYVILSSILVLLII